MDQTKCGCSNCTTTPEVTKGRPAPERGENHMTVFSRLSRITNMHGTPGQPKGRA